MNARSITCDFEIGLMRALTEQFSDASTIFCFFHWKQALRRKLAKLLPNSIIDRLMAHTGIINILPIVPTDEIPKAIAYIRSVFDEEDYKAQFDQFWDYFVSTWCKRYKPGFLFLILLFSILIMFWLFSQMYQ